MSLNKGDSAMPPEDSIDRRGRMRNPSARGAMPREDSIYEGVRMRRAMPPEDSVDRRGRMRNPSPEGAMPPENSIHEGGRKRSPSPNRAMPPEDSLDRRGRMRSPFPADRAMPPEDSVDRRDHGQGSPPPPPPPPPLPLSSPAPLPGAMPPAEDIAVHRDQMPPPPPIIGAMPPEDVLVRRDSDSWHTSSSEEALPPMNIENPSGEVFRRIMPARRMMPKRQRMMLERNLMITEDEDLIQPCDVKEILPMEMDPYEVVNVKPLEFAPRVISKAEMELQSRTEEERNIKNVIKRGKVMELKDTIQPWRLAKCKTNSLLFSLKTSAKLRSLAKKNSSEGQELVALSKSVEEFACALVEPFEHDEELVKKLGRGAVDTVIETSITCKEKKFLSNAVIYNFMIKGWYGHYFRLAKEKDCFLDFCLWFLLHLWSIADILLSPVVFLVLFTLDWCERRLRCRRGHLHVPVTQMSHENDLELGKAPEFEIRGFDEQSDWQATGLFRKYILYLETPYFIFFKDALSYIILLGLHFALCISKSTIPFSILEWIILVFFAGRIVNEVSQFLLTNEERMILQNGDESRSWVKKQLRKYLSDSWNVIDLSTITVYLITLLVRIVTWSVEGDVIQNRALVVAQYLYGLNAALITIRAFGHIMETKRHTGPVQIALFRIVADLGAIGGQFLAIILAFSLALTKLFVAEMSYNTKENAKNSYCKSSGIQCWWQTVKQLIWSLFGMAEVSALNTADGATKAIALILYVVFLVLAVILLVNMMIALLSNTYQRVKDNSVNEWSYKKAITVLTYSSYHPIIVPMNLISLPIYLVYRKCQKNNTQAIRKRRETDEAKFDRVVREDLEPYYWAKYGYSYPPRDEDKTNSILHETLGTRHITSKIAEAVFSRPLEGIKFGSSAWDAKGVAVEGCRMWYTCDDVIEDEHHGAIYHSDLKPDYPKFEVLIQDFGERRFLSIGLVYKDHNHHVPPGWQSKTTKTGTVGFHVDDGRIFSPGYVFGKEIPGSMAHRGDVVGCKLLFDRKTDRGGIPVVFSLNGNDLKIEGEQIEVKPNENGEMPVFPFVSMGYKGISVLFKLCASEENIHTTTESSTLRKVKEQLERLEQKMDFLMEHIHPKDE